MVSIKAYGSYRLDTQSYSFTNMLDLSSKTTLSTQFKSLGMAGYGAEWRGKGFKYDSELAPKAGTVTSFTDFKNWDKAFTVTGFSSSATELVKILRTGGDANDLAYWKKLLSGGDLIKGGSGADKLYGYGGNDSIYGYSGKDVINGGSGNDKIFAGSGADTLYGESGRDTFVFRSKFDSNQSAGKDWINDFRSEYGDKIDLRIIDANSKIAGDQGFSFIAAKDFSAAGQLRVVKEGASFHVSGDINGDKAADFELYVHTGSLTKGDFFL